MHQTVNSLTGGQPGRAGDKAEEIIENLVETTPQVRSLVLFPFILPSPGIAFLASHRAS